MASDSGVRLHNDNGGVITNGTGSVIELGSSAKVYNTGLIEHSGAIQPKGSDVSGILANFRWDDDKDKGVINKYCAGSITVTYFGDPPIDMCAGTIVIIKNTELKLGDDFTFIGSGSLGTFVLDDDYDPTLPNTMTFSGLTLGTYTVTEVETAGFTLTGLACATTEASGDTTTVNLETRTATIDLDGGETVTCTFTNSIASCTPPAVTVHPASQVITYGSRTRLSPWQGRTIPASSGRSTVDRAGRTFLALTQPPIP
jgi:hypothetical protein